MTVDELLTFTRDNLLRDKQVPHRWSDELLVTYINEALENVARLTHTFVTNDVEIELSEGEDTYDIDPDIVLVYSARLVGVLGKLGFSSEWWTPVDSSPSRPSRYTTDAATGKIRFYATPDQSYTAVLRVAMLSPSLTLNDADTEVPLKRQFQLPLADWAAYRCFTNDDADGRNDMAADKAKMRYDAAINQIKRDGYRLHTGHGARVRGQRVK